MGIAVVVGCADRINSGKRKMRFVVGSEKWGLL